MGNIVLKILKVFSYFFFQNYLTRLFKVGKIEHKEHNKKVDISNPKAKTDHRPHNINLEYRKSSINT